MNLLGTASDEFWERIRYVAVSNWTIEVKGSKRVEVDGTDDKKEITALLSCTLSGNFLPEQVVYAEKSPTCLPKVAFPPDLHVTFTSNHWCNEDTLMGYRHCVCFHISESLFWSKSQLHPTCLSFLISLKARWLIDFCKPRRIMIFKWKSSV